MLHLAIFAVAVFCRQWRISTQFELNLPAMAGPCVNRVEAIIGIVDFIWRPELPLFCLVGIVQVCFRADFALLIPVRISHGSKCGGEGCSCDANVVWLE